MTYRGIAKEMLELGEHDELPDDIDNALSRVNHFCERAEGELVSRQVIAMVLAQMRSWGHP